MSVATLPLSTVVNVTVLISPQSPATPTFNQGLIVGTSTVIPSYGTNPRIRQYTSLAAMATDGFATNSPEYVAASLYFGQSPAPVYLNVGRQDLTAIATLTLGSTPGTGYAVGDTGLVVQGGASLGEYQVTAVTAGVPTTVAFVPGAQGTGYAIANNLATTVLTGAGSGTLTVDVTAIGETPLQAIQACRLASPSWYLVVALAAVDADNIAIGEWAQSQTPQCVYFYTTGTAAALNGTSGNVLTTLKTGSYNRAFGIYSTTQSGLAPNNIYAAVAAMGVAMGLNTGLANSFFTMKFKTLIGITPEPLTPTQIALIEGNNGNLYLSYANAYTWLEQGVTASGEFFDTVLNLDMLASDIQYSCVDLLTQSPAVLQTNSGQGQILNQVNGACARAANRGFIAGGIWNGTTIYGLAGAILLAQGASLPNGYTSVSDTYANQSSANRKLRQSMPVYCAIILGGAVHSILIGVYVQQ